MAWSFGHTLIVILALLAGIAAGWLLRGSLDTGTSTTVDGDVAAPPVADAVVPLGTTSDSTVIDSTPTGTTADAVTVAGPASPEPAGTASPAAAPVVPAQRVADDETDTDTEAAGLADTGFAPAVSAGTEVETLPAAERSHVGADVAEAGSAMTPPSGTETEDLTATEPVVATGADIVPATVTPAAATPTVAAEADPTTTRTSSVEPTADEPAVAEPAADEPIIAETAATEPTSSETTADEPAIAEPAGDAGSAVDDLRRIEGIGPKMATVLNAAGIRTYQQLAETEVEAIRAVVRAGGARATASLPTWPQQARVLANGGADAAAAFPAAGGDEAAR